VKDVLEQFLRDCAHLRRDPALTIVWEPLIYKKLPSNVVLGAESCFYRAPGLWVYPAPGAGRPLTYRFPPPMHVLEVLCCLRGGVPVETDEAPGLDVMMASAVFREGGFLAFTERMSKTLLWPVGAVRVLYHLLTPLATNGLPGGLDSKLAVARARVYTALGSNVCAAVGALGDCNGRPGKRPPERMKFWGTEVPASITEGL
jgi:hypothetical protein